MSHSPTGRKRASASITYLATMGLAFAIVGFLGFFFASLVAIVLSGVAVAKVDPFAQPKTQVMAWFGLSAGVVSAAWYLIG